MTHTLHRRTVIETESEDFVLLVMTARGINMEGSEAKMAQVWDVISHHDSGLVNFGNSAFGSSQQMTIEMLKQQECRMNLAVFKDAGSLTACLKELKERDFGISVVVAGPYAKVEEICREVGLTPHTVENSLGIHGKVDRLPEENALEIMTMCGHSLVSAGLIKDMVQKIRKGKKGYSDAAAELSKQCVCGIFNPCRCEEILRKMISSPTWRIRGGCKS